MPQIEYPDERPVLGAFRALDYTQMDEPEFDPDTATVIGAAWRDGNTFGSAANNKLAGIDRTTPEASYTGEAAWNDIRGTAYEPHWERFTTLRNWRAHAAMKSQIDMEREDDRILEAGGWTATFAQFGAQAFDWPSLLPGGALVRGASVGGTIARTALSTGFAGALGATVSETALQATQQTRPLEESILAIGGGAVLGAFLGGGVGALFSAAQRKAALATVDRVLFEADDSGAVLAEVRAGLAEEQVAGTAANGGIKDSDNAARAKPLATVGRVLAEADDSGAVPAEFRPGVAEKQVAGTAADGNIKGGDSAVGEKPLATVDRVLAEADDSGAVPADFRAGIAEEQLAGTAANGNIKGVDNAVGEKPLATVDSVLAEADDSGAAPAEFRPGVAEKQVAEAAADGNIKDVDDAAGEKSLATVDRVLAAADDGGAAPADFRAGIAEAQSAGVAADGNIKDADNAAEAGTAGPASDHLGPLRRALDSPSAVHGSLMADLVDTGSHFDNTARGEGEIAVESEVKFWGRAGVAKALTRMRSIYDEARKARGFNMGWEEFKIAVGKDRRLVSENEAVRKAGVAWRKAVFNPLKLLAIKAGLLPAGVSDQGAILFLARFGNAPRLKAGEVRFKTIVRQWVDQQLARLEREADKMGKPARIKGVKPDALDQLAPEAEPNSHRFRSPGERADYVNGVVDDIFSQVTSRANQGMPFYDMVMSTHGLLKGRPFDIDLDLIEEFLEHDVELIGRRFARVVAADVQLARLDRRLGGPGKPTLQSQLSRLEDDYRQLREQVQASDMDEAAKAKALQDLTRRESSDIADVTAMRDRLRGQSGLDSRHTDFARVLRTAGLFEVMRRLAGMLVSSLGDAVRPAMVHGLGRYMNEGIAPLVTNLGAIKFAAADARRLCAVVKHLLRSRIAAMAGLTDPHAMIPPFEQLIDNMGTTFSRMTLLPFLTDMNTHVSSALVQNRILKNVLAASDGASLPARELVIGDFFEQPTVSLDELYAVVGKRQAELVAAGSEVAEATGSTFVNSGFKDKEKAAVKIARKGYDDASHLTDVVRAGFVVETPARADEVVAKLAERYDVLDEGWKKKTNGYFDRKVILRFDDGTVGEVQLWESNLRDAKFGRGEELYNLARDLDPTSEEFLKLEKEAEKLYSAARAAAGETWSSENIGGFSSPKLLKRSRQASSESTSAVSQTSMKSTGTQGELGLSMANAPASPMTAGRLSQFTKLVGRISDSLFGKSVTQPGIRGYAGLSAADRKYMEFVGIDEDMALRIAAQYSLFGQIEDTVHIPLIGRWTDDEARRAFTAAVNKDVDTTVVTESLADVPLFAHTPEGRALQQFTSFALAANQRASMHGLQDGPGSFVSGTLGMSALGMLVYWLEAMESGSELAEDSETWIAAGLDRSGIMSVGMEINNAWEKLGAHGFYALASAGGQLPDPRAYAGRPAARVADRDAYGSRLGPSFRIGTDAAQLLGIPAHASSGDLAMLPGDVDRRSRMAPFLTLPYWRWLIEGGFGLPDDFRGVEPELTSLAA
ncbi:hypothetical protein IG197_04740 [Aminobacter sp. SR38]|jgi:hypothetical protein|uniref:hypothetical protein n=1 Tax=Aminobacter sp. SR38 TaxID=2774562 RepID=UPI00177B0B69|nr:hypothetical protein [Aminobacter sp. SR38]QOF72396.1 hypothetical protein IG197_04740 [Aminobacter sp. SR38]